MLVMIDSSEYIKICALDFLRVLLKGQNQKN